MSLLGNQPVWGALGPDIHPFLLTLKVTVPADFHIWLCCHILSVRFHSDPNITITKMMLENRSSPWVHGWPRWHSTRSATRQDPAGATLLGPVGSALGPDRAASDLPSVTTQAGDVTEEAPRGVSELTPCSGDGPLRTSFSPQKAAQGQGTQLTHPNMQHTQRHTAHTHRPSHSTPTHAYTCTQLTHTGTYTHEYTCMQLTGTRAHAYTCRRLAHRHTCARGSQGTRTHAYTCRWLTCSQALAHMRTRARGSHALTGTRAHAYRCTRLTHTHDALELVRPPGQMSSAACSRAPSSSRRASMWTPQCRGAALWNILSAL